MATIIQNCSVLSDEIIHDTTIRFADGVIQEIGGEAHAGDTVIDGQGGLVAPGLIDVHCDAIEKLIETRPGVQMPQQYIMPTADSLYAAAGVTTIYHAISFANNEFGVRSVEYAAKIAEDVQEWQAYGSIDHRLHARYEVSDKDGLDVVKGLIDKNQADMVSVMDHSPGQGQFRTIESFIAYYGRAYDKTDDEVRAIAAQKQAGALDGWERAKDLIEYANQHNVVVASHDDDTPEKAHLIKSLGGAISEFPINMETVEAAHEVGLATVLGAPNIVRGGSQSGNMRALDAVLAGKLDCLCADYVPWTMLAAACMLPELADMSWVESFALVAGNPAHALSLDDRGLLQAGKRADLVLLGSVRKQPQVLGTWCNGRLAYQSSPQQVEPLRIPSVANV